LQVTVSQITMFPGSSLWQWRMEEMRHHWFLIQKPSQQFSWIF
jgi:hypothetical protein